MYIFQVVAFIFEIVFTILIGGLAATLPEFLVSNRYYTHKPRPLSLFSRIIWFIIVIGVTMWFLL